ncbi:MAG: aldehyde dehydrogenase family protein, partial [Bdellovibrionales bacterium]|nr:aldehyde dehydrogenase family protein [Bdellovibrionales bacterium]
IDPSTGSVYGEIPNSDRRDIDLAVSAAKSAFPGWSSLSTAKRSRILQKISSLIENNLSTLADAESLDNGKPIWLASRVDIPRASENFSFFANAITTFSSESHSMSDFAVNYTLRDPIGVVACISPWNLPLYLFTWKIAPALATGNCVVAKPSEITPMTAFLLAKICQDAGLPAGVLNIVHGLGESVGQPLCEHPEIKAISFTGGTTTGKTIAGIAASQLKKTSLELGGKNPNVIFADCDYERALSTSLLSSFSNQGQICLCGSRIYVEKSLYPKFREDLVQRTLQLTIGDPREETTKVGAVVSKAHMEKILSCIERAKAEGGRVLCGGNRAVVSGRCSNGYFVEPTIIEGLGP